MEAEAANVSGLPVGQSGPGAVRHRTQAEPEEVQPVWSVCK